MQAEASEEDGPQFEAGAPPPAGELRKLLDQLYDLLVDGPGPGEPGVTREAVEQLLHAHARAPLTLEEFKAFFRDHDLTPRLHVEPAPMPAPVPLDAQVPSPLDLPGADFESGMRSEDTGPMQVMPSDEQPGATGDARRSGIEALQPAPAAVRPAAGMLVLLLGCAALLGATWYGHGRISAAEAQLQPLRAEVAALRESRDGALDARRALARNVDLLRARLAELEALRNTALEAEGPPSSP